MHREYVATHLRREFTDRLQLQSGHELGRLTHRPVHFTRRSGCVGIGLIGLLPVSRSQISDIAALVVLEVKLCAVR